MKLFLTSVGLPPETTEEFLKLLDKKPEEIRVCFITTASHPEESKGYVGKDRERLSELGFEITELDLKEENEESLKNRLENFDVIFVEGGMSSDFSYHCSQTWVRLMNILFCQILNDWSWQFISLPIETEFGNHYDKDVFIKWAYQNGVPLHKARTCVKSFDIECGDCPTCWDRRRGYKEAGVKDPTKYKFPMSKKYPTYYDHEKEEKNEKRNRGQN